MIQLTESLWLKADDCCYVVGNRRERRGKGEELRNPTYYSTAAQAVEGALIRAMRQGVKDGSITSLREFIQEQERLHAELEKLIAPLKSVGNTGEKRGKANQAAETGNSISQPLDVEKAVQPVYIVEW